MKTVLLCAAVLCLAGGLWAADLIPVSHGTVVYVQATDERWVIPDTMFSKVCGFHGWDGNEMLYDTLYEAVAVWERPSGPQSFEWANVQFMEWYERLHLDSTATIRILMGPKRNLASGAVDTWEADRWEFEGDWEFAVTDFLDSAGWQTAQWPWYDTEMEVEMLHWFMQSHESFRYMVTHYTIDQFASNPGLALRVDPSIYGCSRSMWTADTTNLWYPRFPSRSSFYVADYDTNTTGQCLLGSYHLNTGVGGLALALGNYDVSVKDFAGDLVCSPQTFSKSGSDIFPLQLTSAQMALQPDYVEFAQTGDVKGRAYLKKYESPTGMRFATEGGMR